MELRKDIWRPLIVEAAASEVLERGSLEGLPLRWLPAGGDLTFSADPFGVWRDGYLFIFVEDFDYRTAHGTIAVHVLDHRLRWIEKRTVLAEPWHLSYPFVFEWESDMWLLPEACGSGTLTLYRAREFPWTWEKASLIALDTVALDPTPLFHEGLWWLFYGTVGGKFDHLSKLNVAWADTPLGAWTPHPKNPVRIDRKGARPAGRVFEHAGRLILPVQDCVQSYGSALRLLHIAELTEECFAADLNARLCAPSGATPFVQGCHTFSPAGPVTLIDVKKRQLSLKGLSMRPRRDLARWLHWNRGASPVAP
ncbi:glucosamine inositolphosphorylceramide transferase family protein [Novosphingobium album (ex Liu et al. 2023)]|uniref:Formyl transferase n=1 Tax=Novosphingobium album (ex Liu et al. 2023) TaxID=3031130 RepID=A0ABT5WRD2_9SPHN|nr:formyl transferase [Novosphingobium album (ex Liu et al. 2023)]MDE8652301.1 formyl transferase [Novosphingobium album (ex Liu et al. 2023)]